MNRATKLKTMRYTDYLRTPEWRDKREKVLILAKNRCQLCNDDLNLHVHHRTYNDRGDENLYDLVALCAKCHRKFHDIEQSPRHKRAAYLKEVYQRTDLEYVGAGWPPLRGKSILVLRCLVTYAEGQKTFQISAKDVGLMLGWQTKIGNIYLRNLERLNILTVDRSTRPNTYTFVDKGE